MGSVLGKSGWGATYAAAALMMASAGSSAAAQSADDQAAINQAADDYESDTIENTPLGNGWTGNVDPALGSCAIFRAADPLHMSLYSDGEDRDGYWLFSGIEGNLFGEGPARIRLFVNGIDIGAYTADLSVDGPHFTYKLPYLVLRGAFAASPDGMRLKVVQSGRTVHEIDATGARQAYEAYRKCNAAL